MEIPDAALRFPRTMDPSDIMPCAVAFGPITAGDSVASFAILFDDDAVAAGVGIKQGGAYPAPFLADSILRFWVAVDPAKQGDSAFDKRGLLCGITITMTTNGTPPEVRQRTAALLVKQL